MDRQQVSSLLRRFGLEPASAPVVGEGCIAHASQQITYFTAPVPDLREHHRPVLTQKPCGSPEDVQVLPLRVYLHDRQTGGHKHETVQACHLDCELPSRPNVRRHVLVCELGGPVPVGEGQPVDFPGDPVPGQIQLRNRGSTWVGLEGDNTCAVLARGDSVEPEVGADVYQSVTSGSDGCDKLLVADLCVPRREQAASVIAPRGRSIDPPVGRSTTPSRLAKCLATVHRQYRSTASAIDVSDTLSRTTVSVIARTRARGFRGAGRAAADWFSHASVRSNLYSSRLTKRV